MESKDLTQMAPRSPKEMLGGYLIIARTIDKCRAVIAGTQGEYHFNCPLDRMLFDFKGTDAEAFKAKAAEGATDDELVEFVKTTGTPKTDEQVATWNDMVMHTDYSDNADKKAWLSGECTRLGIDPATSTLFDYLDEDDKQSFAK
jgi:hypothetical protein